MVNKSKANRTKTITMQISPDWTPDQARIVLEVIEGLRSVLIEHCQERLRSEYEQLATEVLLARLQPELPF